jgi:ferric-dicitrate binding protein FerR (iron transport regulator)
MDVIMTHINQLLNNFRAGNYSKKDLNELIDMLQLPVHEDTVDVSMFLHWDECDDSFIGEEERFQRILDEIHHIINLRAPKPSWSKRLYTGLSRVAAIIIIPLLIAFYMVINHQEVNVFSALQNTVCVPLGATSQFELPDGTHVWLNSGSTLTYPLTFANKDCRVVALNGEGFFKVHKDKRFPFIVKMNGMDIRVTGTTFNARAYSDEPDVTVALVEGSVLLGKQMPTNTFEVSSGLHPMEVAVLNKTSNQITLAQKDDLTKYTAWTDGRTVFDNDPIQIVIEKLEKLYNIHVVVPDKELLQYHFTATFINESLERALKIISLSSPISFQTIDSKKDINGAYGQRTLILKKENVTRQNNRPS